MSEHSIKKLRRQRDDAKSRHDQMRLDLAVAEKRLHDARCRDSGLMGTKVTNKKGTRILVHDVEFMADKPWVVKGLAYKKDGTVGFSERWFYLESSTVEGFST